MPGAQVTVRGAADLYRIADQYRQAGRNDLVRQLDRGSREAGKVIEDEVRASTDTYIPRHFENRFRQNLDTKTEVKLTRGRRITVIVGARGKSRRRHVKAMNEGLLRHPVFGRTRRIKAKYGGGRIPNNWVEQKIRPGLADEPAARAMPRAKKKIDDAMARTAAKLGRAG